MTIKIIGAAILFLILTGFFLAGAQAQTTGPQLMVTWKARTYAPPGFDGKIMPTANSAITASVELIDGGKIIDLS